MIEVEDTHIFDHGPGRIDKVALCFKQEASIFKRERSDAKAENAWDVKPVARQKMMRLHFIAQ